MNLNISSIIPSDFNDNSRVWIYQNENLFSPEQKTEINNILENFLKSWNAHGAPVKGFAKVLFDKFIVIIADETATHVSGCSTDSFERMIKEIQSKYKIDLFNRLSLTFIVDDRLMNIDLSDIENSISNKIINFQTLYFNNTVLNKKDLLNNWVIPAGKSWLEKYFTESHQLI